jgi:hypothetical protein
MFKKPATCRFFPNASNNILLCLFLELTLLYDVAENSTIEILIHIDAIICDPIFPWVIGCEALKRYYSEISI